MKAGKWLVYRCKCSEDCRSGRDKSWVTVSPVGYHYTWGSWDRAMLRATKGY